MNDRIETSRPLSVARGLVTASIDEEKVYAKTVVLTGETQSLRTQNGKWCFTNALRILSRVVGNLIVALPPTDPDFLKEVQSICERSWSPGSIQFVLCEECPPADGLILSIGSTMSLTKRQVTINSNGWLARLSTSNDLPSDMSQANPIGALMAASLGATEVFKWMFDISESETPPIKFVQYSLWDHSSDSCNCGPALPDDISLPDTLLVGGGAIGNGIVLVLSQLPIRVRLHIIDKQSFAPENKGTCVLMEEENWLGQPKAEYLAEWLRERSAINATGSKEFVADAISGNTLKAMSIDLVLNGLDDVDARRETQRLWPSTLIDGGINPIGAAVIQHRLGRDDLACMECWFPMLSVDEKKEQRKATGLSDDALSNPARFLTEEDVQAADEEKRGWLMQCVKDKKPICSVISEGVLLERLGVEVKDGFRPSVPFVATASSALVMAEALKATIFPEQRSSSMFQISNLFIGPQDSSISLRRAPNPGCKCVVHASAIKRLAANRKASPTA